MVGIFILGPLRFTLVIIAALGVSVWAESGHFFFQFSVGIYIDK